MHDTLPTLGTYRPSIIRVVCRTCGRQEEHSKERLLVEHGPEITMSKLLPLIAKCERRDGPMRGDCRVRYLFREDRIGSSNGSDRAARYDLSDG